MTPATDESILRLDRVTVRFGTRVALDAVSLAVRPGEVLALLGPNGAGKSTAFAVLLGHRQADEGTAHLHGVSVADPLGRGRAGVGVMPDAPAFYEYLSGFENLCVLTSYSPERVTRDAMLGAADFVGLGPRIHERVRTYSRGMRQRLALAQALLPDPDLVLLDEPAEGLDPEGIAGMHALILRLKRERGITVVLASHLLPEIEAVADRVAILVAGRLVFDGTLQSHPPAPRRVRLAVNDWERAGPALAAAGATREGGDIVTLAAGHEVGDLVTTLVGVGVQVRHVEVLRPTLADVYRRATSESRAS